LKQKVVPVLPIVMAFKPRWMTVMSTLVVRRRRTMTVYWAVLWRWASLILVDRTEKVTEIIEFLVDSGVEGLLLCIHYLLLNQTVMTILERFLKLSKAGTVSHNNRVKKNLWVKRSENRGRIAGSDTKCNGYG
jgi:hypothetical protein